MKKVILAPCECIVSDDLTYEEACRLMELANKHSVSDRYDFFITLTHQNEKWSLMARDKIWAEDFLKNPQGYLIQIE